jgi:hypothetical protein
MNKKSIHNLTYINLCIMKSKRREFLKLTGMAGIGIAGARILPDYTSMPAAVQEDKIDEAPEWVQNADMFTSSRWYVTSDRPDTQNSVWRGYDIELKDVPVERIVRLSSGNGFKKKTEQVLEVKDGTFDGSEIKGVSLVSHVPVSKTAFQQAHEQGFRVIPYVHFTDIHSFYADQDVFLFQHPEVLLKDADGKWIHIPMDGTDRVFRLLTCTNNPSYVKLSLAYIKKIMDWGADGIFIDNTNKRRECYAHKSKDTVNPEFGPYVHEHIYPEETHNYAFGRFLESVRTLVKSYGKDKIVMLNSGIGEDFQKHSDVCMWESFIFARGTRRAQHTWDFIKERARQNEWYVKAGRRITALSTPDISREGIKEDIFWGFCAARLVDFVWWASLKGSGAEELYQVHLGKDLQLLQESDKVAYRAYENGVLVLNDNSQNITKEISLPKEFKHKQVFDLYEGKKPIKVTKGKIKVAVPKQSARVYIITG